MNDVTKPHGTRALLLVGHGMEDDPAVGRPVRMHANRLSGRDEFDEVRTAFWDEEPAAEGALERFRADEVVVLPFFMSHGYYGGSKIPEVLGLDGGEPGRVSRVAGRRAVYTEAIGTHPRIVEVVQSRLLEMIGEDADPADHAVVVFGHGTDEHSESDTSTRAVAEWLADRTDWGEVHAGFMDEEPTVVDVLEVVARERVLLLPFFVADGPHVAEDVPRALGAQNGRGDFPLRFEDHVIDYGQPVGTAPEITELLAERAREGIGILDRTREEEGWPLRRLMSEVVGSGPKSSSDMTREQALEAMERLLDRRAKPETSAGFLLANRWKANTPEELGAFLDVQEDRRVGPDEPAAADGPVVDCGASYDGKRSTLLLGVAAGLTSAELGAPVAVHSAGPVPTKEAVNYRDVLAELGVRLPGSVADSDAMLETHGFGFYDRRQFLPAVADLIEHRRRLGVRTFLNTIETLANPARAAIHLGSFYHLTFATRMIDASGASKTSRFERIVMFQGLEGYDDVRPGSSQVVERDDSAGEEVEDFEIETDDLGMSFEREDLGADDLAAASARATEEVLRGDRRDEAWEAVCLNAAVRAYAAGRVESVPEGVERAKESIEEGGPGERLACLRSGEGRS
ncbi:MAG: CbiX/SirB N-terminal domain-containing protein [Bradymonadaceae bacterium]